jgi:hypothetical protein
LKQEKHLPAGKSGSEMFYDQLPTWLLGEGVFGESKKKSCCLYPEG